MIVVQLQGGLGNQMFQYAFGRSLSLSMNVPLKLDLSFLQNKSGSHTKRDYELDVFMLNVAIASDAELKRFARIHNNKLLRKIHHRIPLTKYNRYIEPRFSFIPHLETQVKDDTLLIGFWQSEKYFLEHEDMIRKDFTFRAPFDAKNAQWEKLIRESDAISLHVRRGDYITNAAASSYHGTSDISYYRKAFDRIAGGLENAKLFIFSDDPDWVREHIRFDVETHVIDNNTGKSSFHDMHLMSLCRHHIIANSSFSWWGAWLNSSKDKIVVAPERWFAKGDIDTRDLIPASWLRM